MPGFETVGLAAILAPAGTPPAIVDKLHREIAAILKMPDVRGQLEGMGLEIVASSPSEFARLYRRRIEEVGQAHQGCEGDRGLTDFYQNGRSDIGPGCDSDDLTAPLPRGPRIENLHR